VAETAPTTPKTTPKLTGWAVVHERPDGRRIVDSEGETVATDELDDAVERMFAEGSPELGDLHERKGLGGVVGAIALSAEDIRELFGVEHHGGLLVKMAVRDRGAAELIKSGARPELSVHGATQPKELRGLVIDEISMVDRGASGNTQHRPRIALFKRAEPAPTTTTTKANTMPADFEAVMAALPEDQRNIILAYLEAMKTSAPMAEAEKACEPEMAPEMKKRFEAQAAETVELRKRLADLTDTLERVELEKRAAAEYPAAVGLSRAETIELVALVKRGAPQALPKLEQALRASSALAAKSAVFEASGVPGQSPKSGSAYDELVEIAKSIRAKAPTLPMHEAVRMASESNPELAKRYAAERSPKAAK
jgi:hypothetical protein